MQACLHPTKQTFDTVAISNLGKHEYERTMERFIRLLNTVCISYATAFFVIPVTHIHCLHFAIKRISLRSENEWMKKIHCYVEQTHSRPL